MMHISKSPAAADLALQLLRHVWNDWILHVHTNGHNPKSWFIGFACGVAAQFGPGATLTLALRHGSSISARF